MDNVINLETYAEDWLRAYAEKLNTAITKAAAVGFYAPEIDLLLQAIQGVLKTDDTHVKIKMLKMLRASPFPW